jgi:hypothetical protein
MHDFLLYEYLKILEDFDHVYDEKYIFKPVSDNIRHNKPALPALMCQILSL